MKLVLRSAGGLQGGLHAALVDHAVLYQALR